MEEVVYTESGMQACLVGKLDDGRYLVRLILDSTDEEYPFYGELRIVETVFYGEPPVPKYHERITQLKEEIFQLTERKVNLEKEIAHLEKCKKEMGIKYSSIKALERLDDFIDGKITHYVQDPDFRSPQIVDIKNTESKYSKKKLRLLTLFGESDGDLSWGLNRYSDGSGGYVTVIPCCSFEEAKDVFTELLSDLYEDKSMTDHLLTLCKEYDIEIKPAWEAQVRNRKVNQLSEKVEKLASELEIAQNELEVARKC